MFVLRTKQNRWLSNHLCPYLSLEGGVFYQAPHSFLLFLSEVFGELVSLSSLLMKKIDKKLSQRERKQVHASNPDSYYIIEIL